MGAGPYDDDEPRNARNLDVIKEEDDYEEIKRKKKDLKKQEQLLKAE